MKESDSGKFVLLDQQAEKNSHLVRIWSLLAILEGLVAIGILAGDHRSSEASIFLGLSRGWMAILITLIVGLFGFLYLAFRTWKFPGWTQQATDRIQHLLQSGYSYGLSIGLLFFGVFLFSQLFHFSGVVSDPYIQGYLLKLRPVFFWLLGLSGQTLIMLPLFRYGVERQDRLLSKNILTLSVAIFCFFLVIGVIIAITGLGVNPDIIGWDGPGTPILFIQLGLIWVSGILFLAIEALYKKRSPGYPIQLDLFVSLLFWGIATLIWSREPLKPDYFAPAPRAPNYEVYPYSDAALHDVNSQELLVGEGFPGVSRKPLYVLFLALLHTIGGQNYLDVISLQVGVLALIPVLIYWLTKDLHHRLSGFIAAGLIILRERNAISLSGYIRVSHSKLMMSDLPAVLAIVLLTWLVVAWLQEPQRKRLMPIWIGGVLGLLMLLRPQFSLIIPLIFILIIFRFFRQPIQGLGSLVLILLGLFLTLSPWLWRSYQITGSFTLNDPNQMAFLTEQYHRTPQTESLQLLPGETMAEFNERINAYLKNFVIQNPGYVTKFITSHFFHNEIEMLQVLPLSFSIVSNPDSDLFPYWRQNFEKLWNDCCSIQTYVKALKFWDPWLERIQSNHLIPMILNLAILSIGLAASWHQGGITAWFPLGISLVYSFSTAIGRYSGWRLILPADWVIFLYLAIGLSQSILWLKRYFYDPKLDTGNKDARLKSQGRGKRPQDQTRYWIPKAVLVSLVLFGMGLTPLMVEAAVPRIYQPISSISVLRTEFPQFSEAELQEFLAQGGIAIYGRALYPRFYRSGEGEPGESWAAFLDRTYPRLGFFMVGPYKGNIILRLETPPEWFPHASDVFVLGCQEESYLDAAAIKIDSPDIGEGLVIVSDTLENLHCPLSSQQ